MANHSRPPLRDAYEKGEIAILSLKGALSSLSNTVVIWSFPFLDAFDKPPVGFFRAFDVFVFFVLSESPLIFVDLLPFVLLLFFCINPSISTSSKKFYVT